MKLSDNIWELDFKQSKDVIHSITVDLDKARVLEIREWYFDEAAFLRVLPVPKRKRFTKTEKRRIFWDVMVYGKSFMPYRLFKMLIFWLTNRLYPSQGVIKRLPTNSGEIPKRLILT